MLTEFLIILDDTLYSLERSIDYIIISPITYRLSLDAYRISNNIG